MILVTGGAGFIGANFVLDWLAAGGEPVVTLDKLTYAGNPENLASLKGDARHVLVQADICDRDRVRELLAGPLDPRPWGIHPDQRRRHLQSARGGACLVGRPRRRRARRLPVPARLHGRGVRLPRRGRSRVQRDDRVRPQQPLLRLQGRLGPSDHLVRAYHHTYGLPTLTTNCSNNYGPYQFPEKLIPLMIANALAGKPLPVYGDGQNVRDWLYVGDHCAAIRAVLARGRVGEVYNIGGNAEMKNLDVVRTLCATLDDARPRASGSYADLVTFVKDRPGHDRRYAIDARRIRGELGWSPAETFDTGLAKTVRWYLDHAEWVAHVQSGEYRTWIERNYAGR